jgi:hypothetical protein
MSYAKNNTSEKNNMWSMSTNWKDLVMPGGGWIGSRQISETNAAVKSPVGTTDVVPVLPRVSVLPVPGRYYRQGRVD